MTKSAVFTTWRLAFSILTLEGHHTGPEFQIVVTCSVCVWCLESNVISNTSRQRCAHHASQMMIMSATWRIRRSNHALECSHYIDNVSLPSQHVAFENNNYSGPCKLPFPESIVAIVRYQIRHFVAKDWPIGSEETIMIRKEDKILLSVLRAKCLNLIILKAFNQGPTRYTLWCKQSLVTGSWVANSGFNNSQLPLWKMRISRNSNRTHFLEWKCRNQRDGETDTHYDNRIDRRNPRYE